MSYYDEIEKAEDESRKKNYEENMAFFNSLNNEEKFELMWQDFVTKHCDDYGFAKAHSSIKKNK